MRAVEFEYHDPLELVWIETARRCGMNVVRDAEVFAAWDGEKQLRIGTPETLDADDSLAQIILHELCHALVAGQTGMQKEDWGLDYDDPAHAVFEHAALRLQAALSQRCGLRQFLGATTDYRDYYDQLPSDPLADDPADPAAELAKLGRQRLSEFGWEEPISKALRTTAHLASLVRSFATESSLWITHQNDEAIR